MLGLIQPTETERRTAIRTHVVYLVIGALIEILVLLSLKDITMLDMEKHFVEVAMYDYLPG